MSTTEIIVWSIVWYTYLMFWTCFFAKRLGRRHRQEAR